MINPRPQKQVEVVIPPPQRFREIDDDDDDDEMTGRLTMAKGRSAGSGSGGIRQAAPRTPPKRVEEDEEEQLGTYYPACPACVKAKVTRLCERDPSGGACLPCRKLKYKCPYATAPPGGAPPVAKKRSRDERDEEEYELEEEEEETKPRVAAKKKAADPGIKKEKGSKVPVKDARRKVSKAKPRPVSSGDEEDKRVEEPKAKRGRVRGPTQPGK